MSDLKHCVCDNRLCCGRLSYKHSCLFVCFFFFGWNNIGFYLSWILIDSHPQLLGPFSDGVRLTLFCFFDKINYCLHYFWGFHRSLLVVLLTIRVFIFFHKRECKRVGGILKDLHLCLCSQSLNHMHVRRTHWPLYLYVRVVLGQPLHVKRKKKLYMQKKKNLYKNLF